MAQKNVAEVEEDIAEEPDAEHEIMLNHAIWYGSRGFDVPYPGEERVLWPEEVMERYGIEADEEDVEADPEEAEAAEAPETRDAAGGAEEAPPAD